MLDNIPIYKAESNLKDLIQKNNSVAYHTLLEPISDNIKLEIVKSIANLDDNNVIIKQLNNNVVTKLTAGQYDSDLYFVKSILVTTNWNKNDDVFDPIETWNARHTPAHKPTNLEHDETQLVGHIVDAFPIDIDGNILYDNCEIDELPLVFHLVTGSVIYRNWTDVALQERTDLLIKAIEAKHKFVSMETFFTNFDYKIQKSDGQCYTKVRNEDTAWMTQYLRAYGGTGSYDGYKIGRLLRNLTFCGKGYVDKPANPESIIFNSLDNFTQNSKSGVLISLDNDNPVQCEKGDFNMENLFQEQNTELKKTIATLEEKLAVVNDKLAKADVEKYTQRIEELEDIVKAKDENVQDLTTQIKDFTDKIQALEVELKSTQETKVELESKFAQMEAETVKANRISTLVDGGIDKEVATKKVETFANLSDEQFSLLAEELISVSKSKEIEIVTDEKTEEEIDSSEANVTDETLEVVDTEDKDEKSLSNLEVDQNDDEDNVTEELVKCLSTYIGKLGRKVEDLREGDN